MRKTKPLLALALVAVLALVPLGAANAASSLEYEMYSLLSEDRAMYGKSALVLDEELCAIARVKSTDMLENGYFAHLSPTYGNVRGMLNTFGYSYVAAGENIARSRDVYHADAAFLSSAGHRRNVLASSYTHVGIGIATDANGFVYVTEIFVRR